VKRLSKAWPLVLLLLMCESLRAQEYSFRYFGVAEGLNDLAVRAIYQDHAGFLWVATANGFFRYNGDRFEAFGAAQGVPSSPASAFGDGPDGSLLAGGAFGLIRLRGDHFEKVPGPFKSVGELQGIQADGKGHTFLNTDRGLMELSVDPGKEPYTVRPIPPRPGIRETGTNGVAEAGALLIEGDAIWYGCGFALCHLEKGLTQVHGTGSGLPASTVVSIRKDQKGDLWLRLRNGGVFVLPAGQSQFRRPILPNPNQMLSGVPSTDAEGQVLLPMPDGMLLGSERNWRKIDHSTGLRGAVYAAFEDRQHSLWICMAGPGLVQWRGYREWENYTSASGPASDAAENAPRENAVVFRYRIEGANSAWTETTQRELQFAQLAPGNYRLEIEAQGAGGVWRPDGAELAFRVLAPWYRQWWFFTLCGLISLCAAALFLRIRMTEAKRKQHDLHSLAEAKKTIELLAFFDPLTELPNRRTLTERLRKCLVDCSRNGRLHAALSVDLDKFKAVNDSFGHGAGDLLLKEAARRLTDSTRGTDTVARLAGDEFVVILEDLSEFPKESAAQAEMVARKIVEALSQPYRFDDRECLVTTSIGIAIFGILPQSTEEVLQQADIAMCQAKAAGGNAIRFFAPELQATINARASLEQELRTAINQKQFLVYYQPQVDNGIVIGAEALVRWQHPIRSILAPAEFISLCEETGLIIPLGDWVLETACRQLAKWAERKETAHLSIAVNISARQLRQPEFVEKVLAVLERTGANPSNLELELTESMLVENLEEAIATMTELRFHGLRFSLDDFGTGYSSLNYLRRLPLDRLKIDRAFVQEILTDVCGRAIAQAIVSLSSAMGLPVLAEGVESEEQQAFLASLGCHMYQGYLFSRPVPLEEFEKLLAWQESTACQVPRDSSSRGTQSLSPGRCA
jgi:diguanylate cyclase (GGDEF)-like protein